ncbi:hypothetical protein NO932_11515 [Pelagibacterium sp. 26DY04]|uniref:hypothetical protein n=1 Tax=Pelagibacterium sp. 26DY04 TaxID=2967130 RepID=UPI0028153D5E|nr:hypothetical protein [Pelagibacterium sp. 26DY04]WMT85555.1 hypothetical protein NO932_11515 [Pelagibacterium sp. 26DY04]
MEIPTWSDLQHNPVEDIELFLFAVSFLIVSLMAGAAFLLFKAYKFLKGRRAARS